MPDKDARAAILVKILQRHGCAAVDPALLSPQPVDGSGPSQLQVRPPPQLRPPARRHVQENTKP